MSVPKFLHGDYFPGEYRIGGDPDRPGKFYLRGRCAVCREMITDASADYVVWEEDANPLRIDLGRPSPIVPVSAGRGPMHHVRCLPPKGVLQSLCRLLPRITREEFARLDLERQRTVLIGALRHDDEIRAQMRHQRGALP